LWTALRATGLPIDRYAAWSSDYALAPLQDRLTTDVSAHLIARHRPELLLVHYLALDCYQHLFGPGSSKARWALGYVDAELGRLLDALARADLVVSTTVVVTADHGFTATRTRILPNVWLRQHGLLEADGGGHLGRTQAFVAANGGVAGLSVEPRRRDDLLPRLVAELGAVPGVSAVVGPEGLPDVGLPHPEDHPQAPDALLIAASDAYFDTDVLGDEVVTAARLRGTHGHPVPIPGSRPRASRPVPA
jgi:hypothetical protein